MRLLESLWTVVRPSPARLAVGALLLIGISSHAAGSEWTVVTDEDGVKAWTQKSGEGLPLARAVTTIDAPLCNVLAIIRDVDRHCEWMADCAEARVLERQDWANLDMYLRIKGYPWVGVADRDAAVHTLTKLDPKGSSGEVTFARIDGHADALGADTVHMPRLTGAYTLKRLGDGKTEVEYRFHADLGGWVPDWIATKTVEELPWETLKNLRSQVSKSGDSYGKAIQGWPQVDGASPCAPST